MTDEQQDKRPTPAQPFDPRLQQNFAERLFPGPSRQMSPQTRKNIEELLKTRSEAHRKRGETAASPSTRPTQDAALTAKLDEQTELLKAILSSSVDTQTDARATAQNSRTFAWAGTAIAVLTLVATVISIIAVVQH